MNKKDLPEMYSTMFWCLLVVLLVFFFWLITTVTPHFMSQARIRTRQALIARRGEEKDSLEMPCLPRMAHKAPVMQASNKRHDERKRYWCLSVGLVLKNSFNDTIIEEHLDVEKGERFACMSG